MKNTFWKFMLVITIVSFIFTIIFGSQIPWGNLSTACFSWPITKGILYDISVGIFSSMILVWCIDRIQLRMEEKEEEKRRLILYSKISPLLEEYYNFYLYLYIATRNVPVAPNSKALKSLYLCKDEFIKQLYDTNPFYKDGYYGDPTKLNLQFNLMQQCSDNPEEMEKIMSMSTSLPWYQCWHKEATKFYNGLSQVEKDFPTFFPNELLELIDSLLTNAKTQTNIVNIVEFRSPISHIQEQFERPEIPTEMFIKAYKIEETLQVLDSIMSYIESDSSKVLRERNLDFFNNRNISPSIGHTCPKESTNSENANTSTDAEE